jgi:hypothetical protein
VDLATITYSPRSVAVAETVPFLTLTKGMVIICAFARVDQPSDSASTGTIGVSGDTQSLMAISFAPSADLFSAGQVSANLRATANLELATAAYTISLTWTPGASPGVTPPIVTFRVWTERLF